MRSHSYEALRDFPVDVLAEGAPLVVMTRQAILPEVIDAMRLRRGGNHY